MLQQQEEEEQEEQEEEEAQWQKKVRMMARPTKLLPVPVAAPPSPTFSASFYTIFKFKRFFFQEHYLHLVDTKHPVLSPDATFGLWETVFRVKLCCQKFVRTNWQPVCLYFVV